MEDSNLHFPPLTKRQLDLLEEIKTEKEKLAALSFLDPDVIKVHKRIDELTVKALRFALRNYPSESRRPGFFLVFDPRGEHAEILPGFGYFHPDLPQWAKNHFVEWIRMLRAGLKYDARKVLRETGIVGIETGIKPPEDFAEIERWGLIKRRVLELRGANRLLKN